MRLMAYLRLRRLGLTDEAANQMLAGSQAELAHKDDVAVIYIIGGIGSLFAAYGMAQYIEVLL